MRRVRQLMYLAVALAATAGAVSVSGGGVGHPAYAAGSISYLSYKDYSSPLALDQHNGTLHLDGVSQTFPDGGNDATGVVLFNYLGSGQFSCGGGTENCPSGVNSNDYCFAASSGPTLSGLSCAVGSSAPAYTLCGSSEDHKVDTGGGTVSLNGGSDIYSTLYDRGTNNCDSNNSSDIHFTSMPSGTYSIAIYFNDDSGSTRSGCFYLAVSGGANDSRCTSISGGHGQLLEWSVTDPSTLDIYQNNNGNQSIGGIFFLPSTPTAVAYASVHQTRSHGKTTVTWIATEKVAGFNVYDGKSKLNGKIVTSHTSHYKFVTTRVIHHLKLAAVPLK